MKKSLFNHPAVVARVEALAKAAQVAAKTVSNMSGMSPKKKQKKEVRRRVHAHRMPLLVRV